MTVTGLGGRPGPFRSLIGTPDLSVLADAFRVAGGLGDPSVLRSDAGIYLHADVYPILRVRETSIQALEIDFSAPGSNATTAFAIPIFPLQADAVLMAASLQVNAAAANATDLSSIIRIGNEGESPHMPVGQLKGGVAADWFRIAGTNAQQVFVTPSWPILLRPRTTGELLINNTGSNRTGTFRLLVAQAKTTGVHPVSR